MNDQESYALTVLGSGKVFLERCVAKTQTPEGEAD
jgi:hypothetical protein